MKLILALISLAGSIFMWWIKQDEQSKAERAERKKDIHEAVTSGDVSRINAVIQRLRNK